MDRRPHNNGTVTGLAAACALLLAGCNAEQRTRADENRAARLASVHMWHDMAVDGGVLAQHTLYPYHFRPGSAELNELGERDLSILSRHYRDNPGALNLRRGTASDELYAARMASVRAAMAEGGVDPERVTIADQVPGGAGMDSESVLQILDRDEEAGTTGSTVEVPASGSAEGGSYGDSTKR